MKYVRENLATVKEAFRSWYGSNPHEATWITWVLPQGLSLRHSRRTYPAFAQIKKIRRKIDWSSRLCVKNKRVVET